MSRSVRYSRWNGRIQLYREPAPEGYWACGAEYDGWWVWHCLLPWVLQLSSHRQLAVATDVQILNANWMMAFVFFVFFFFWPKKISHHVFENRKRSCTARFDCGRIRILRYCRTAKAKSDIFAGSPGKYRVSSLFFFLSLSRFSWRAAKAKSCENEELWIWRAVKWRAAKPVLYGIRLKEKQVIR